MSTPIAPGGLPSPSYLEAPGVGNERVPVKKMINRHEIDPQVLKSAEGMEAMFVDHMLQAMRKSVPTSEYSLENGATKIYRGMLDSEIAKSVANAGGLGLTEQIVEYLESTGYNVRKIGGPERGQPVVSSSKDLGGSHED